MDWDGKISALKGLIGQTGPLWSGTRLSGYAESGPYHCGDCEYMFKGLSPKLTTPGAQPDLCKHHIVVADKEIRQRSGGFPIVSAANGCCEFVEPKGRK